MPPVRFASVPSRPRRALRMRRGRPEWSESDAAARSRAPLRSCTGSASSGGVGIIPPQRWGLDARRRRRTLAVLLALTLSASSRVHAERYLLTRPETTFVAHEVHAGLAIDKMRDGEPTVLRPKGWFRWPGEPILVMHDGQHDVGLWLVETGSVVVRDGVTKDAPVIGRVEPSWDDGAIRLTLWPRTGPPIRGDVFVRTDPGAGPSALARWAADEVQVQGAYDADFHAANGSTVGWLGVDIGYHQAAFVMYEGYLPPEVDEALAAATAVALDSEIDWILAHTQRVYDAPEDR